MTTGAKTPLDSARVRECADLADRIRSELGKRIVGMADVVDRLLVTLLAGGHALLVGVPGLAKTLLIRSLADLVDLSFRRIQFTPDLMPTDVVGTEVLVRDAETGERTFQFMQGPVFANVLLADEINRTPPKTQAALMEAMEENQVTSVGRRYPIEAPFFVLATQNPIEQEGTYPLPAGQLDRFLFNIRLDYPDFADEAKIVRRTTTTDPAPLSPILSRDDVLALIRLVRSLPAPPEILAYAVRLARRSRPRKEGSPEFVNEWVAWGAGPRAAQSLIVTAKAVALLDGRDRPTAADVRSVAEPVFRHRLLPSFQAQADGVAAETIVTRLLETTEAPDGGPAKPRRRSLLSRLLGSRSA